ncbi:bifunctional acetate--CoA ligase family protein/GNAT family N-acetyltransferase [Oharaeibacter diazotrophicus]|uniref:Acetyltransferase n=1 Tax=Oharaeibacter diazotrophicus TaxID=1920512 RepID=A0A4R6RBJ6_9HYPH|nr:bifunctional acetate--CoA ligase family protein/GNAT family N-acetyltransferase [Oharaeibacter diazotrophicus]TDP83513.1 acetyltransferase [Oharaeibacter diazotrophicus]BBE72346.1 succinyl-CoA ligase [ADP-forming] subunit alpha [Pleomorphomonas sp. SM30]GLS79116.1 GCN5 family N-acetyltransferase [Oharaeibacter diazotrophicus]
MSLDALEAFFRPSRVALVGASTQAGSVGNIVARNLIAGYGDRVMLVNPRGGDIDGAPLLASIEALPAAPDLGVIAVPAAGVVDAVERLGARGAKALVIISAGLGQGPGSLGQQAIDAALARGMRVIGPNCIGVLAPGSGLNASFAQRMARKGDLALISQSGAILTSVLDWAEKNEIGFSGLVSIGDAIDVGFAEMLDYYALDHNTRAILLYVEAVRDARAFMSAARAAARTKPVVVIKSGRHTAGAKAAASHTGALAGVDAVYDAAFRRAGLLRVEDLGQLFAAAETLSLVPRVPGKRVAVVTNGGGVGVLAVDRLVDLGGTLAQFAPETMAALEAAMPPTWSKANPVDIVGDAPPARYGAALDAVLADPGVDAVVVMNCPTALASSRDCASAVVDSIRQYKRTHFRGKAVIACWLGNDPAAEAIFTEAKIPVLGTPNRAIEGLMQLIRYADAQETLTATPPDLLAGFTPDRARARAAIDKAIGDGRSWLTATEVSEVLAAYDVQAVPAVPALDPADAEAKARDLLATYRAVVAKIASPDIVHKSDVGGVELELTSPEAVATATARILERARAARPDARIEGVTLHPMIVAPKAVELIAGVADDPVFGPILVFGRGGTAVEVINDKALALPPLDVNLALDLIGRTRVSRQLAGYRDRKPVDREKLALGLVKLSQLVAEEPRIREIDLNPIIADHERIVTVDARISVRADTAPEIHRVVPSVGHPRLAIRPYPSEWEQRLVLRDGTEILVRPLKPEDERLYPAFFARMSDDDMRLRFFARVRELGHAFIARLTQIDYARAMAFIAIDPARDEMLGAVRLHGDAARDHGEYAIAVRSDLKGMGLGWELMRLIVRFARREGYAEIRGEVLRENTTMLDMCASLGFEAHPETESPEIMAVRLDLAAAVAADPTLG